MLEDFLQRHDVDIALLQEVTNGDIINLRDYNTITNIGVQGRGTAILSKLNMHIYGTQRIPSGRGVAVNYGSVQIVNIYAPSGSSNRTERETFFNSEIVQILPHTCTDMILAGDFNCILSQNDSTGNRPCSRALDRLVQGLHLTDAWDAQLHPQAFTHYTPTGAARIDRFYLTEDLYRNKQGVETLVAAFTDHLAVLLRVKLMTPATHRGRNRWRMNTTILDDITFRAHLTDAWGEWKTHQRRFPDIVHWWVHYVKRRIKDLFTRECVERNRDRRRMEEFYYTVMYEILQRPEPHAEKLSKLKQMKARIIRLNTNHGKRILLDLPEQDRAVDEPPTLHHLLKARKRQGNRLINQIIDENNETHNTSTSILKAFSSHFQRTFQPIKTSEHSITQLIRCGLRKISPETNTSLTCPISKEELMKAIYAGKPHKSPGIDGICLEFYKIAWEVIKNEMLQIMNMMLQNGPIMTDQVQGHIVCIPKKTHPKVIGDYRPLTLLNVDYKLLARVLAGRLKLVLPDILHPSQHCGTPGNTIFEAAATVRDVIANSAEKRKPTCLVSIDFTSAFDRISHEYMRTILSAHGLDNKSIECIMGLYKNATSEVQINGFRSRFFPIKSSIRQGCPLSMLLFDICINPLLHTLDEKLTGVKIGRRSTGVAAVAYADDVTVFLSTQDDVQQFQEAIRTYEAASGARVNTAKSKALALGGWDDSRAIMDIPYCQKIKILGYHFSDKVNNASKETWSNTTSQVRAAAQNAYYRELSLDMRIKYVHDYLLARIWYVAHIFPIPAENLRQLNTTSSWFIWRGEIFRVPLSTLHRGRDEGGYDLVNIWAKCMAIFIHRTQMHNKSVGSLNAAWLATWDITTHAANPPFRGKIPASLEYIREYVIQSAYVRNRKDSESEKTYKKYLYTTMKDLCNAGTMHREMRIMKIWPHAEWETIWGNLQATPVSDTVKSTWYRVIHDIIPTNYRLHRINMSTSASCSECGGTDTLEHRLTECGEGFDSWEQTRSVIARILRSSAACIPNEWLLRPSFRLWPTQRQRAVLWVLAQFVYYRLNRPRILSRHDLMDFLRRAKWKLYRQPHRSTKVANFLIVIDT